MALSCGQTAGEIMYPLLAVAKEMKTSPLRVRALIECGALPIGCVDRPEDGKVRTYVFAERWAAYKSGEDIKAMGSTSRLIRLMNILLSAGAEGAKIEEDVI